MLNRQASFRSSGSRVFTTRKGLNLPISGPPIHQIQPADAVTQVGVVATDFIGLKPSMAVKVGTDVRRGDLLFHDKRNPLVNFTAPIGGTVSSINRGARRSFQSLVIDIDKDDQVRKFPCFNDSDIKALSRADTIGNLLDSGAWTAFRTRPFSKIPDPKTSPSSIFITAIDTNPLAADPSTIIALREDDFYAGMAVLCALTAGDIHLCTSPNLGPFDLPSDKIKHAIFDGPHPAGLAGTHIHFIDPVSEQKSVWTIGYQDLIAIGSLFRNGELDSSRIISVAGPQVRAPRLVPTIVGANLNELLSCQLSEGENRIISGSVLSGRAIESPMQFLGRYDVQVSVIEEGRDRVFLHYLRAGSHSHSSLPIFVSSLRRKKFAMNSSTNGSERAMVPLGQFENLTPMDILPTQLLRSLVVGDTEMAQKLGCLELDEEDLSLFTYSCVGKYEYGPILRQNLTKIEAEG